MAHLIDCPYDHSWQSNGEADPHDQVAQFLWHFADAHGSPLPDALRDAIKGCAKQLEDLPVPTDQ